MHARVELERLEKMKDILTLGVTLAQFFIVFA